MRYFKANDYIRFKPGCRFSDWDLAITYKVYEVKCGPRIAIHCIFKNNILGEIFSDTHGKKWLFASVDLFELDTIIEWEEVV